MLTHMRCPPALTCSHTHTSRDTLRPGQERVVGGRGASYRDSICPGLPGLGQAGLRPPAAPGWPMRGPGGGDGGWSLPGHVRGVTWLPSQPGT